LYSNIYNIQYTYIVVCVHGYIIDYDEEIVRREGIVILP